MISQILKEELEQIKKELIDKHNELGMKASGNWEQSLSVEIDSSRGVITGEPYTDQLISGREPGKFPPIALIEDWIKAKGITPDESDITISSLAFLIARKIANEGTEYFKKGGTDLVDAVITPKRIDKILERINQSELNTFIIETRQLFQTIAA